MSETDRFKEDFDRIVDGVELGPKSMAKLGGAAVGGVNTALIDRAPFDGYRKNTHGVPPDSVADQPENA